MNTVGKGENAGNQHFHLFSVFSTQSRSDINILSTFNLSANAFNLVTSKSLSFGSKGLNNIRGRELFQNNMGKGETCW